MAGMQRNDSASVISSLQMDYADSDEEEGSSRNNSRNNPEDEWIIGADKETSEPKEEPIPAADSVITDNVVNTDNVTNTDSEVKKEEQSAKEGPEVSPVDFISDDEDEGHGHRRHSHDADHHHNRHHHHHHHHHHPHNSNAEDERLKKLAVSEAVNTDSPSSQGSVKAGRKATRLVSYGPDEDVEDDESSSEEEQLMEENDDSPALDASDACLLSRSVQNMSSDDIQLPPEPTGKCPYPLQKKIEMMYDRMRKEGLDLNRVIQNKKNFRNPSIYEKLIEFCHIDEKGTNFPVEVYDPHLWGKESFYDELDKAQRKDMERREKEKKERTKIEFMTGTKKPASSFDTVGVPDEKKRKSKWDAQPPGATGQFSKLPAAQQNPGVVNLTSTATGTKATVIPAVGALSKKPPSTK